MRKFHLICAMLFCLSFAAQAQEDLKIKDVNGNVLLEVREDGVLIRQFTTTDRENLTLTTADNGLLVYDTNTKSFWAWKDTQWVELDDDTTNELELPASPSTGAIVYYDGNQWQSISPGQEGQSLVICNGIPSWACTPKVSTNTRVDITGSFADISGNIAHNGGAPVTARGITWSTSSNPTLADNVTNAGTGTGSFTSTIINLSTSTTYYARAYATNSFGTAYGEEAVFTITEMLQITLPNGDVVFLHPVANGEAPWGDENIDIQSIPNYPNAFDNFSHLKDFNGELYTQEIVNTLGNYNNGNYAAKICADLVAYGFDDWYLPSAGELVAIFKKIGLQQGTNIPLYNDAHWSSTERSNNSALAPVIFSFEQAVFSEQPPKNFNTTCRCMRKE